MLTINNSIINLMHEGKSYVAAAVIWPILSALCKAALFIGADVSSWQPVNEQQELFLDNYYIRRFQLEEFSNTEIRSWASKNHEELNKILTDEGFTIKLGPFGPQGFGVVSILDVFIKWFHEGTETQLVDMKGISYPADVCKMVQRYFSAESMKLSGCKLNHLIPLTWLLLTNR